MRARTAGVGAIGLLLLMIVIVVSVLGVLAAVTARADLTAAQRQADYISGAQDCVNQANRWLLDMRDAPDGEYERTFTDGEGHFLDVEAEIAGGAAEKTSWRGYTQWDGDGLGESLARPG